MLPQKKENIREQTPAIRYASLAWTILVATIVGCVIINASRIMDFLWLVTTKNPESITIPHLPVTLANSGTESVSLPVKGNCLLWPPEPHSWDYECGYEFLRLNNTESGTGVIRIPAEV